MFPTTFPTLENISSSSDSPRTSSDFLGELGTLRKSTSCQIGLAQVLAQSTHPKLLFARNPGAIVSPAMAQSVVKGLKNYRLVQLSSGLHYLQEDHPDVIGANIKEWKAGPPDFFGKSSPIITTRPAAFH